MASTEKQAEGSTGIPSDPQASTPVPVPLAREANAAGDLGFDSRDTRDRLIEAISAHGPITARRLAEMFDLTSAAVRRHLATLEAEGVISEHEVPVRNRGRGRPSKSFVLSAQAHDSLPGGYDDIAVLAMRELEAIGGDEAIERLAASRVADWESQVNATATERAAQGKHVGPLERLEILADLLTERGFATTVRPLNVPVRTAGTAKSRRGRTVLAAQLCHGHCPVRAIASEHAALCAAETEAVSAIVGAPVQRLATIAQGAHACTTHVPLTEGRSA